MSHVTNQQPTQNLKKKTQNSPKIRQNSVGFKKKFLSIETQNRKLHQTVVTV